VVMISDVERLWESTIAPHIQQARIIVCELVTHAALALKLLASTCKRPDNGKECMCIGISSPLVWAQTPKKARPSPGQALHRPLHSSDTSRKVSQQVGDQSGDTAVEPPIRGTVSHGDLVQQQSGNSVAPWECCDFQQRRAASDYQSVKQAESIMLQRHIPGRVLTAIICPGVLYGNGECQEGFLTKFAEAWSGKRVSLAICGEASNVIPTVHVVDLASGVRALAGHHLQDRYILLTDNACDTQQDILQAISIGLGSEAADKAPPSYAITTEVQFWQQLLICLPLACL
jgi:hypothetical protein